MREFFFDLPTLGRSTVASLEKDEKVDVVLVQALMHKYFEYENFEGVYWHSNGVERGLVSEIAKFFQTLNEKNKDVKQLSGISKSGETPLFRIKSPRSSIDIDMTSELMNIKRLGLFCEISYRSISGLQGVLSATYDFYRSFVPTKPWLREKLVFELNRKMPVEFAIGFMKGLESDYLLLGTHGLLVDAIALRLMGIPLESDPFFSKFSKLDSRWEETHKLSLPSELRVGTISHTKRLAFRTFIFLRAVITHVDRFVEMVTRSSRNLYRIPSFLRKRFMKAEK